MTTGLGDTAQIYAHPPQPTKYTINALSRGDVAGSHRDISAQHECNKADMTTGFDPDSLNVSNENPTEIPNSTSEMKPDSAEMEPRQVSTVRRKRRRRNFLASNAEYTTTHASPTYVAPVPDFASERRRRRSRRRSNRRKYTRALKVVMYIAIQVVFITLLVFLWMRISAKVNE